MADKSSVSHSSRFLHAVRLLFVQAALMLAIAGLCSSCSSEESDDDPAGRGAGNDPVGTSRFNGEIEKAKAKYQKTAPPTKPPVFAWDFSNKDVHEYAYQQDMRVKGKINDPRADRLGDMEPRTSFEGPLLIKSQGDGTANVVLKDLQLTVTANIPGKTVEPMTHTVPPIVIKGMKEDGSGPFGDINVTMSLPMLFPLPTRPIKVGETVDVPAKMPFAFMGHLTQVKGRYRITLGRYVKIGKRLCAEFDVDTDISEIDAPAELEGEYKCVVKGTSVFYYDVANRSVVSGTLAILTQTGVDAPMGRMKIAEKDVPDRLKMFSVTDGLLRLKPKE